jgi:nucleoside-diphosphate-sugar epimerase
MRAMVARLARALDLPIGVSRMPRLVLRTLGLFSPLLREVAEMAYQWDAPYIIDDSRFRAAFGLTPTPMDAIVGATAAWARATYGAAERRAA